MHLGGTANNLQDHMQWSSFSRVLCFFETSTCRYPFFFKSSGLLYHSSCSHTFYDTSLFSGMYWWKKVCCFTTSIATIHFFYGTVIISWEYLKRSIMPRTLCLALVATIHYNKWPVVDPGKLEGYCVYLRKAIVSLFFKGACLFHRTSCGNVSLKSTVLNA